MISMLIIALIDTRRITDNSCGIHCLLWWVEKIWSSPGLEVFASDRRLPVYCHFSETGRTRIPHMEKKFVVHISKTHVDWLCVRIWQLKRWRGRALCSPSYLGCFHRLAGLSADTACHVNNCATWVAFTACVECGSSFWCSVWHHLFCSVSCFFVRFLIPHNHILYPEPLYKG